MLELRNLSVAFGGVRAVDGIDLTVRPGERVGLIGPNGAGKSTLLALIAGVLRPTGGKIVLAGRDVTRSPLERRARLGIRLAFQHARSFEALTVQECIEVALGREQAGAWARVARTWGLEAEAGSCVRDLGLSRRKLLGLAQACAVPPALLLLDEPFAGLSEAEAGHLGAFLGSLHPAPASLIVEHRLTHLAPLVDRVLVLDHGRLIAQGTLDEVLASDRVRVAYLGEHHD
jgi:branched-chain amino acid transport system ATP-binding protein